MKETEFHRDNHYVPCVYLRGFATPDGRIWTYRTLVSHPKVPLWKLSSIRGVAYHSHLYTRIVAGRETDEIERWLDREFEAPAQEALQKAISDERLKPDDWERLYRFLAAQDVRTPARLAENLERWRATLPGFMKETAQRSLRELEQAKKTGKVLTLSPPPNRDNLPLRVTVERDPDKKCGRLKCEIVAGRGFWVWGIERTLTQTVKALSKHRWTILKPPDGFTWFTSDDPVIKLSTHDNGTYDFKGGWGRPRTEIMLPLSPRHLLCAQVKKRLPRPGTVVSPAHAAMIRRFIAEHAHRAVFAASQDAEVPKLRLRRESAEIFRAENEQWRKWHEEQTAAERELMGWSET